MVITCNNCGKQGLRVRSACFERVKDDFHMAFCGVECRLAQDLSQVINKETLVPIEVLENYGFKRKFDQHKPPKPKPKFFKDKPPKRKLLFDR